MISVLVHRGNTDYSTLTKDCPHNPNYNFFRKKVVL